MCVSKEGGGLGFRNLHCFNLAMLGNHGWHFLTGPDALVSRILKAKYFPRGGFVEAEVGNNPSFIWRSIWSSQNLLKAGLQWKIGDGSSIHVWVRNGLGMILTLCLRLHFRQSWLG